MIRIKKTLKLTLSKLSFPLHFLIRKNKHIISLLAENFLMLLRGKSHRYRFDVNSGLYYCHENGAKHYFGDIVRGDYLYNEGIKHRSNMLANSYMLNEITFKNDDKVIDCGANYGDLCIWLQTKLKMNIYYAIEPGEREFSALQLNA